MVHVTTKIDRPAKELVDELGAFSAATIHEAQGRSGAFDSGIKPIDRDMSFCGPAFTVVCHPRDNIMLQVAISYAQPGDVLIVSSGDQPAGQFGDVLANACVARGIAALVTDGGVRDSREIRELGFPVFSKHVCIQGTVKESLGPINQPLVFGGQLVRPGDVIKGDCDGVVLTRREEVRSAIDACRERDAAEAEYIERYKRGETPIQVSNLAAVLESKGLTVDV
ncbi:4-carboxy-4-hydroxy-2-oxoadipate aldolase/oxaloacetate decarboxylase [Rhodococcus sp. BP-252]|uniref:4-carboxy-4-hydroxy-2-oxoadipate aldolase/oxaloacetate decarboxylase n=1 Tax=unclassified Rhodococcus (in: high G+C Gram-positive bacteria) TaxID=192944 RepID=UPI000DF22304|nr:MULTISPECIES: 4-carboxy-4-hydroxy-2-oxoadipate aldolase/oxaloacetate decarboxylase [unclassified Rhodococcus (in: high G+C Gram-positive bacteria)]MBY6410213.1 4-carboxy-4-hydroxy-2-oxoadipate aldolase/oxaloacetate decarboxylase [Rhodococcus sp. BP-320]MBY6415182.1 4-carboxy-4-hydroxy-2-oxoadipate aldolase/oxaloacetate decarboxylase [Rhodococcus sp. BP-321]MBY6421505.1 4-carboxy-4-hydroxy-2-oxoadipate aldolase/oxaloacetate decarboxylase [Rhodococcus sp. BP-324]MBY6425510.1 4-carboxy-4-hydrox